MSGKKLKVELNQKGIKALKREPGVMDYMMGLAESRTPEGCSARHWFGKLTNTVVITPETDKAKKANLDDNTLLKAIG